MVGLVLADEECLIKRGVDALATLQVTCLTQIVGLQYIEQYLKYVLQYINFKMDPN